MASSNSNRLRELAERLGVDAYLIDNADHIQKQWTEGKNVIGLTAGASAPENLVKDVIARLVEWGAKPPKELPGREETIHFALPKALRTEKEGS